MPLSGWGTTLQGKFDGHPGLTNTQLRQPDVIDRSMARPLLNPGVPASEAWLTLVKEIPHDEVGAHDMKDSSGKAGKQTSRGRNSARRPYRIGYGIPHPPLTTSRRPILHL